MFCDMKYEYKIFRTQTNILGREKKQTFLLLEAFLPIFEAHLFHTLLGTSSGSAPTLEFSGSTSMSHSIIWGTPAWPIRISSQLHESCMSACRKYRPSVHSAAPHSLVTTATPSLPEKPEMYVYRRSRFAGNSLCPKTTETADSHCHVFKFKINYL